MSAASLAPDQLFAVSNLLPIGPLHVLKFTDESSRLIRAEVYEDGCGPEDDGDGCLIVYVTWCHGRASATAWNGMVGPCCKEWKLRNWSAIRDVIESAGDYERVDEFVHEVDRNHERIDC